jgi:RNA polymerase sigma factor (sigma-70 family)
MTRRPRTGSPAGVIPPRGEEQADDPLLSQLVISARGLDERERTVLWRHYGLGWPPQTLTQIGDSLGLTAERIRQIEAGALKKLREAAAAPPEVRAT